MKALPVYIAMLSYFLYASQAAILEQKLGQFSTATILLIVYIVAIPLAVGRLFMMVQAGTPVVWPSSGASLGWVAVASIVFFLADFCMVRAYTLSFERGGQYLFEIVAVGALFPVFAVLIKWLWTGALPNRWSCAAFITAFVTVMFAAKSVTSQMPKPGQ